MLLFPQLLTPYFFSTVSYLLTIAANNLCKKRESRSNYTHHIVEKTETWGSHKKDLELELLESFGPGFSVWPQNQLHVKGEVEAQASSICVHVLSM